MINSSIILDYLSSNKERFSKEYNLTKIGIFGSIARDENNNESDIDIVVEFKPDTPDLYSIKLKLKNEIESQFHKPVDICRLKYINPIFKNHILSEIRYA